MSTGTSGHFKASVGWTNFLSFTSNLPDVRPEKESSRDRIKIRRSLHGDRPTSRYCICARTNQGVSNLISDIQIGRPPSDRWTAFVR